MFWCLPKSCQTKLFSIYVKIVYEIETGVPFMFAFALNVYGKELWLTETDIRKWCELLLVDETDNGEDYEKYKCLSYRSV